MKEQAPWIIRAVRWVPGYRVARRRVIRLLRRSPTLRRVLGLAGRPGRTPQFLAGARHESANLAPIVLLVGLGLDAGALERSLAQLTPLQDHLEFRLFVVTDQPVYDVLKKFGVPVEQIARREAFERLPMDITWHQYVAQRCASARLRYAAHVLPIPQVGWGPEDGELLLLTLSGIGISGRPGAVLVGERADT